MKDKGRDGRKERVIFVSLEVKQKTPKFNRQLGRLRISNMRRGTL